MDREKGSGLLSNVLITQSVRYNFRTAEERENFFEAVKYVQQSLSTSTPGPERALALGAPAAEQVTVCNGQI